VTNIYTFKMPAIKNGNRWQPKYNLEMGMGLHKSQFRRHYKIRWFTIGFWRFHFQKFLSFFKLADELRASFTMCVEIAVKDCPDSVLAKLLHYDDVHVIPTPDEYKF